MNRDLHIVAFDVPFPPDYGGVIDVFYKLKALYEEGIKISLHCFEYGRGKKTELEKYCHRVFYYRRKTNKHLLFNSLPYIVASRSSDELLKNLLNDDAPILFEGLHCCFYLNDERLHRRKKIVRMHNIEHLYYSNLACAEKNFFRKQYFEMEAKKLKKFESVLNHADAIICISPFDTEELSTRYKNVTNIMAFHPHTQIEVKEGKGNYALYHGSLSVGENNRAALYLVNEIYKDKDINVPLVIAGNGASAELKDAVKKNKNIQLRENISTEKIYSLIRDAQVNILPAFQTTGIKLKLLSSFHLGRHCLVNSTMVKHTGLEPLCSIADSPAEMKNELIRLMSIPFTQENTEKRKMILEEKFSNKKNAKQLLKVIVT